MKAIEELRKMLAEAQRPRNESSEKSLTEVDVSPKSAMADFRAILAEATSNTEKSSASMNEGEIVNISGETFKEENVAELTAKYLNQTKSQPDPAGIESRRWNDPLTRTSGEKFVTTKELQDHYGLFLNRIQQQLASLGGGGEVKFRYLDDVNRSTMLNENDNHLLEYDAASGKVQFTNKIGPIDRLNFDLTHIHDEERVPGTLCWSDEDQTLNLQHPSGVTQQIGQELYAYVRNRTGATIPDGTVVRFDGAEENGAARLLIAPFLANGTFPNLYGIGITTSDILDGDDGKVTVWGKLRELDTSTFNVGDILYASPNVAGGMTNVKPTAPNNVLPVAAVLRKDSSQGEIFVRPTIEQSFFYGSFVDTQDHTAALPNTPYAVPLNRTEFSSGVIRDPNDNTKIVVQQSGLYNFQFSIQFLSTNASAKDVYIWAKKNGDDIPDSSTRVSVVGNNVYFVAAWSFIVSLNANDFFQLMWAASDVTVRITAPAATAFSPTTPSTIMSVTQVAQ
jgi:hypothetical protein